MTVSPITMVRVDFLSYLIEIVICYGKILLNFGAKF